MTPAQCRAARALIGLSQEDAALAAGVGIQTLIAFENGKRQPYARTLDAIRAALEAAGVIFVPSNGEGPGVRLRKT
jgi:transcriptional regulator with XRE-family HTH domain